ncbi:MAG: THUMP domain-containing protein, partial [Nannocystaceae bacterium]
MSASLELFATCPLDLEGLLADELAELGAAEVRTTRAGVSFTGDLELAYRVCMWSRLASRILLLIGEIPARSPDELYRGVVAIDWTAQLAISATFVVDVAMTKSHEVAADLQNAQFAALRVKDGIVDQMREHWGTRPSVDRDRPDVRVHLHLRGSVGRVCIDLSGNSLHRRGYRLPGVQAAAPLKENLA